MTILSIVSILVFSIVLCIIEVPTMLKDKSYKDLWTFSILLILGMILAILKKLDITLPNPSDWVALVYSPVSALLKTFLE